MRVTLWGTRGSLASPGPETNRYGGNTSCVVVRAADGTVLVLDAGTGIRRLGDEIVDEIQRVDLLLTHFHMDHIQGLGFFEPLFRTAVEMHIWGPSSITLDLRDRLSRYLSPPLFPVRLRDLPRRPTLHDVVKIGTFEIGPFTIHAELVCHPGPTVGYRIEENGASLAYLPDHEPALGLADFPGDPDWGDLYNPVGAEVAAESSFTNGFFLMDLATSRRELLANVPAWQEVFTPDDSLERTILGDGSLSFDDDNNGEWDRLTSSFVISGPGVDLNFDLVQVISQIVPAAGQSEVAVVTQTYTVTNNSGAPIDFNLVRHLDMDLVWNGSGFADDSVGTGTNDSGLGLFAFMGEQGADPGTYVTVSAAVTGGQYYGAKSGIDPDGPGPGPAMGAGTDTQQWDSYGVPVGWENYIAGLGNPPQGDGESGPTPNSVPPATGGPGADGSIGLSIPVSLAGLPLANGHIAEVVLVTTFGANTPLGAPGAGGCVPNPVTCPYDCELVPDCNVGINDFLRVLATWGGGGSCAVFDGTVGINDFLGLLGVWGPCP